MLSFALLFLIVVRQYKEEWEVYTDKKEKKIFLKYKEIQSGAIEKSYMRKGFLIYDEMHKYLHIYEEAVSHLWLCDCSILHFLIYEENLIFCFISVQLQIGGQDLLLLQHGVEVGEEAVHVLGPHVRVRAANIIISQRDRRKRLRN